MKEAIVGDEFSPVFLSVEPMKGYGIPEYEKLEYRKDTLVHLDGLHRLIAWAIARRLGLLKYFFSRGKVASFIAGPLG